MSEINRESVYGGSMTPEEWVAAEMEVKEMQGWVLDHPEGFTTKISDVIFDFQYHNTRACLFDGDFFWMSFVYHKADKRSYYLVPGDTEASHDLFMLLIDEIVQRGFSFYNRATPTREALNFHEKQIRAGQDIGDVIDQILSEGS